jgi:hypothetical protein
MHIFLWVVAVLLALAYLFAGFLKAFRPLDEVAKSITWVPALPPALVRFIGAAELLGAIGLIVPAAARVLVWLTPLAAVSLVVLQVLAIGFHVSRRETNQLAVNVVLLLLAAVVAYGRLVLSPLI